MSFAREVTVKATRKHHRCAGCDWAIEVGSTANRWVGMTDGNFGTAIYHPDCRAAEIAYNRMTDLNGDEWSALRDLDREGEPWLRKDFPAVAGRLFGPVGVADRARDMDVGGDDALEKERD